MSKAKVWAATLTVLALALCLAFPGKLAVPENMEPENAGMIARELKTPDGGTAALYLPAHYAGRLTETQMQDFANGCKDGDSVTIEQIILAE